MFNKLSINYNPWGVALCFVIMAAVFLMPDLALAQPEGTVDDNAISQVLCNIIILLQGNIARGIAAGGVIFLGFSLFLGKISWGTAMAIGIGLGAIFGAQAIVNLASGTGNDALQCNEAATIGGQ